MSRTGHTRGDGRGSSLASSKLGTTPVMHVYGAFADNKDRIASTPKWKFELRGSNSGRRRVTISLPNIDIEPKQ